MPAARNIPVDSFSAARANTSSEAVEKRISGVSVVMSTFQAFMGTSSTASAARSAVSSSRPNQPRSAARTISAASGGRSTCGRRISQAASENAASGARIQPTIGGWS